MSARPFVASAGDRLSVRELGAEGTVSFAGSVPPADIPRYTSFAAGLVASLSASPDLGLTVPAKLASYMAAAKPLLASMDGEGAAAVAASGGGLTSPAQDAAALAENMLALYRMSEAGRAELGRRAFAWYQAHYRRRAVLDALENFIL